MSRSAAADAASSALFVSEPALCSAALASPSPEVSYAVLPMTGEYTAEQGSWDYSDTTTKPQSANCTVGD